MERDRSDAGRPGPIAHRGPCEHTGPCPRAATGRPGPATGRRVVLQGALGATVLGTLVACGGSDGSGASDDAGSGAGGGASGGSTGSTGSGEPSAAEGGGSAAAIVGTADVPEGGGVIVGDVVVTQPTAGEFRAFGVICTHQQCPVTSVEDGQIICPCHASTFSVEDGAPLGGPAEAPLEEVAVTVQGTDVVRA